MHGRHRGFRDRGIGGWLLLLVLVIYTPFLIVSLSDPAIGVKLQGINYFADTTLFAGVVLALASAGGDRKGRTEDVELFGAVT